MAHSVRRCAGENCNALTTGRLCHPCNVASKRVPLKPCLDCNVPLHRKSLPKEERLPGSKYYGTGGRCHRCHNAAVKAGRVQAPIGKSNTITVAAEPRIIVEASLSLDERAQALCAQVGYGDLWFPEKGSNESQHAKEVCAKCPIRLRCLEVAVQNQEAYGVFGGMTATERRPLVQAYREQNGAAA